MYSDRFLEVHHENDGNSAPVKGSETHIHGMTQEQVDGIIAGRLAQAKDKFESERKAIETQHAETLGKLNEQLEQLGKAREEAEKKLGELSKNLAGFDELKVENKRLKTAGLLRDLGVTPERVDDARVLGEAKGWFNPPEGKDELDVDGLKKTLEENYSMWLKTESQATTTQRGSGTTNQGGKTTTLTPEEELKAQAKRVFGG